MPINQNCQKLVPILFFQLTEIQIVSNLNEIDMYGEKCLEKCKSLLWSFRYSKILLTSKHISCGLCLLEILSGRDQHFKVGRAFIGKLWSEISNFSSPDYWIPSLEKKDHFHKRKVGKDSLDPYCTVQSVAPKICLKIKG